MKKILVLIALLSIFIVGCGGDNEVLNGEVELDLSIAEREGSIGKSDKDFTELTTLKPSEVRNDATGKWRKITLSKGVDIAAYILSYNKLYMDEDTTVHSIINFGNKTTAMINNLGSYISVRVHEYQDKEEHDAKELGGGMFLKEYHVYKDNGDIVEVE